MHCIAPPYIENTDASKNTASNNTTLRYSCLPGHRFPDGHEVKTLQCMNQQWSQLIGDCACKYLQVNAYMAHKISPITVCSVTL